MNEQLLVALSQMVESVNDGVSLLSSEMPFVIQELLLWKLLYHFATFLVGISLMIYTLYSVVGFWKKNCGVGVQTGESLSGYPLYKATMTHDKFGEDNGNLPPISIAVFFVVLISQIIGWSLFNVTWVQILIAPKLFLVEYTASLLK